MSEKEVWYRVDDRISTIGIRVYMSSYLVLRHTPKGVWVRYGFGEKFILNNAKKRWAYPTKEEAMQSFIARKRRQISILTEQLHRAKVAKSIAEGGNVTSNLLQFGGDKVLLVSL